MDKRCQDALGHCKRELKTVSDKLKAANKREKEMKKTKKAEKVLDQVQYFVSGFRLCKGRDPEVIHLSKSQIDSLGVEVGEKVLGIPWEQYK